MNIPPADNTGSSALGDALQKFRQSGMPLDIKAQSVVNSYLSRLDCFTMRGVARSLHYLSTDSEYVLPRLHDFSRLHELSAACGNAQERFIRCYTVQHALRT
jgi:hypothetical protein